MKPQPLLDHANSAKPDIRGIRGAGEDYPSPKGEFRNLQNEFPA